ncbi:hypothetical protein C8J57DRAFT_1500155 [Mycena rebaudengoi]|nr:hypothetical protein C8J57DRAFT_1500155 [Mycena rebaudengoi]
MASLPLDKASFLALILETLLYGVFLVLFVAAVWIILKSNLKSTTNPMLLVTLALIWILSTVHLVIDILRANQAFISMQDGSANNYYLNLSHPLQVAKTAVYVTLTLVGDSFAIFRCYVVGGKWYITIVLLNLLAGTAVSGYGATVAFSRTARGSEVFLSQLVPWITAFLTTTFVTNVCSFLAYRILRIQWRVRDIKMGTTNGAIIIVESAALYSFSVLAVLIAYLMNSNAQYTLLDLTSPLIGIAFTAIVLRVSLGLSSQESVVSSHSLGIHPRGYENARQPVNNRASTMLTVNVTHVVEMTKDDFGDSSVHIKHVGSTTL